MIVTLKDNKIIVETSDTRGSTINCLIKHTSTAATLLNSCLSNDAVFDITEDGFYTVKKFNIWNYEIF